MKVAVLATDNREPFKKYSAPVPEFGTAPEALLQGFALLPQVEVHVVTCIRQPVQSPSKLAPNIHFHSLVVPKIGWMRTGFIGCIRAARKRLAAIGPDIVHAQGTERESAMVAAFSGHPSVLTIHGNMRRVAQVMRSPAFSYVWLAAKLEAFTVPRVNGVVCITRHTQTQVSNLARRTWLLPNAVDPSFFDVPRAPRPAVPRLLCVGQVYEIKNQIALIRALDELAARRAFVLDVVGEAKEGQNYADEFRSLVKSRPWCVHSGFADRRTLKRKLSETTLLIQPSLEDNCPMAMLEAMAAGVPVLAANVAGLPDLVEEGSTGFLCDPKDAVSMRSGVEKLLANLDATERMGAAAKATALKRFHPRVVAEGHLRIYREVLSGSGR